MQYFKSTAPDGSVVPHAGDCAEAWLLMAYAKEGYWTGLASADSFPALAEPFEKFRKEKAWLQWHTSQSIRISESEFWALNEVYMDNLRAKMFPKDAN